MKRLALQFPIITLLLVRMDASIQRSLRRIGEHFGGDRCLGDIFVKSIITTLSFFIFFGLLLPRVAEANSPQKSKHRRSTVASAGGSSEGSEFNKNHKKTVYINTKSVRRNTNRSLAQSGTAPSARSGQVRRTTVLRKSIGVRSKRASSSVKLRRVAGQKRASSKEKVKSNQTRGDKLNEQLNSTPSPSTSLSRPSKKFGISPENARKNGQTYELEDSLDENDSEDEEFTSPEEIQEESSPAQAVSLEPQNYSTPKSYAVSYNPSGFPVIENLDVLSLVNSPRSYVVDSQGNKVYFTLNPGLQLKARAMLQRYALPWAAMVAIEPRTGKILALSSYSQKEPNGPEVATRATFPAASLFKLVTAAAAIEKKGLSGDDIIRFRGGNYTLGQQNAFPDDRRDTRKITFAEALGRSINPAFARVALNNLSKEALERYALNFGFNNRLPFDGPIDVSHFEKPADDYETARTGAGFGAVTLSPLHAAVLTATIANKGLMMRPYLVDQVISPDGNPKYRAHPTAVRVSILSSTAKELLAMMQATVDLGTARAQFLKIRNPFLKSAPIAAKTGTLSGDNPKGMYHWFVAAVPADDPEIAVATLIIDPGSVRVKSSALARELLEYFFRDRDRTIQTQSEVQRKSGVGLRANS